MAAATTVKYKYCVSCGRMMPRRHICKEPPGDTLGKDEIGHYWRVIYYYTGNIEGKAIRR